MDSNPDEFLPVESAGNAAGISPRTLRYWIKGGKLPATEGPRGRLVKLADVLAIAELTGKRPAPGDDRQMVGRQVAGNRQGAARSAGTPAGNVADDAAAGGDENDPIVLIPAPTDAARAQLEAVRDEWLRPFVADVERLSREVGRLQAERDAALAEVERLRAAQDAPTAAPAAPGATGGAGPGSAPFHPSVAAWRRRTTRAVDVDAAPAPWWRFWGRRR